MVYALLMYSNNNTNIYAAQKSNRKSLTTSQVRSVTFFKAISEFA